MNTVSLNGVEVYPFRSGDDLLCHVEKNKGILIAINAEKILHATDQTRQIINRNIGYCDGVGAVTALERKGYKDVCKIPGCELWLKIVDRFYKTKTFYLIGAKQNIIEATVEKLEKEYPGIQIVGYRNGYIGEEERSALIDDICVKKPDVVFVAMGSPKQEILMEEIRQHHDAIFQGLGGSFDVYTGHVERAPEWWVRHNLEFLYRLIRQPKRIKRQIYLVKYAYWLITNKL